MPHPGDHRLGRPLRQRDHGGPGHGAAAHRDRVRGNRLGQHLGQRLVGWGKGQEGLDRLAKLLFVLSLLPLPA